MITRLVALTLGLGWLSTAWAAEPTIEELLLATDDFARGDSSTATTEMYVKTARYERTMKMKTWAKGTDKTLVVIEEPAKDKGMATLKVDDNIWNYLPKTDRTMKLPAGMMGGSWMGSHFTNDDLVQDSRLSEKFDAKFSKKPVDGEGNYIIDLMPKEDAAVVWGKITLEITPEKVPVSQVYYDEDGELVRTMSFSEVKEIGGRKVPTQLRLIPADKPNEETRFTYVTLDFDTPVSESTFSLQSLKSGK